MKIHHDILQCLSFFTRIPLSRRWTPPESVPLAQLVWAFPIVGAILGLICGEFYRVLYATGLDPALAAALMIAFQLWLTGALHEDGLADTVDGFAGARDKESRLAIMRDSRIGSFGTLALILSVGLRAYALALLSTPVIVIQACIVAGALSRAMIAIGMYKLPRARADGLAAWAGRPTSHQMFKSVGLACIVALLGFHAVGLALIAISFLGCYTVYRISQQKIGGITGDVYGAIQQSVEIAVLITATLWAH